MKQAYLLTALRRNQRIQESLNKQTLSIYSLEYLEKIYQELISSTKINSNISIDQAKNNAELIINSTDKALSVLTRLEVVEFPIQSRQLESLFFLFEGSVKTITIYTLQSKITFSLRSGTEDVLSLQKQYAELKDKAGNTNQTLTLLEDPKGLRLILGVAVIVFIFYGNLIGSFCSLLILLMFLPRKSKFNLFFLLGKVTNRHFANKLEKITIRIVDILIMILAVLVGLSFIAGVIFILLLLISIIIY